MRDEFGATPAERKRYGRGPTSFDVTTHSTGVLTKVKKTVKLKKLTGSLEKLGLTNGEYALVITLIDFLHFAKKREFDLYDKEDWDSVLTQYITHERLRQTKFVQSLRAHFSKR